MTELVTIRCPAKINLMLAVGPRCPPGSAQSSLALHRICSWMVCVDLYDDLTISRLPPDSISRYAVIWASDARRTTEIDWSVRQDLAVRAHLLLERTVHRALPIQAKLEKRIPVASGLGGGSSDAAGMLIGCNQLFALGLAKSDLQRMAVSLGSDVAFFLESPSALVEAFGNRTRPAAAPEDLVLALFVPDFSCATAEVYHAFDAINRFAGHATAEDGAVDPGATATVGLDDNDPAAAFESRSREVHRCATMTSIGPDDLANDLQSAAFQLHPGLEDLARSIAQLGDRRVHLTGSGSGLFALCDDILHAQFLAAAVEKELDVVSFALRLHDPAS